MTNPYTSLCDDFYVNLHLNTEMELPTGRETVLHFFERLRKNYPGLRNFYCRENGDFVLEEDKESGSYRWITIEPRRICSGYVNPPELQDAVAQHELVLEMAPYHLSVSPLDCEALDLLFGFDFTYRGNHDELVVEALGVSPALEGFLEIPGTQIMKNEPSLILSLDQACRIQCRVSVETRTNPYQIRSGEYSEDAISVFCTLRQYGSLGADAAFRDVLHELFQKCQEVVDEHLVRHVLRPLAQAISTK